MLICYNTEASKKPTNLTINSDLLNQAKLLKINISSVLESALAEAVRQKKKAEWLEENKESISLYNSHIEKFGVFSDDLRTF
jgi:antitoxin CcdA